MRKLHRQGPVALALILSSLLSSCVAGALFTKTRPIFRRGKKTAPTAQTALLSATREELNQRISRIYNGINSFQAWVDMTPSAGSVYKGRITEIKDMRALVLFRKPDDIRIQGQTPVVRTAYFDMVSNGTDFRLYLNTKNLFIEGSNDAPATSKNKLENIRPEAFLSSMLIRPADDASEVSGLIDQTDEDEALYLLLFVKKDASGQSASPVFTRSVWFYRTDLSIARQIVYDTDGAILSDTRYSGWKAFNGASFPSHIDINRPKDEYGVVMDITEMNMNKTITSEQLVLNKPESAQLQVIGKPREAH